MAFARAIRAGSGFVEMFLDDSALRRGLVNIGSSLRASGARFAAIGSGLAAFGTAGVASIAALSKEFASFGDVIDKTSLRTGVSATALSQLKFAAEQTGSGLAAVEKGFFGLSRSLFDLERGGAASVDAFAKLGISFEDLNGLSPEDQMFAVADGLSRIADASTRGAVAQQIFGRSGRQLLPLLNLGAAGMRELAAEADALGLTFSGEAATSAANLTDAWNRAVSVFRGVRLAIGEAVADGFTLLLNTVARTLVAAIDFIKQNQEIVRTVLIVSAGLAAAGAAIAGFGIAIITAGALVAAFSTVIGGIAAVFGVIGTAISFVLSPIGLFSAAFIGMGVTVLQVSGVLDRALQILTTGFESLSRDTLAAFRAIRNAIAGGDISAAVDVLWAFIDLQFAQGITSIQGAWERWRDSFVEVLESARTSLAGALIDGFAGIQDAWIISISILSDAWTNFTNGAATKLAEFQTFAAGVFLGIASQFDDSIDLEGSLAALADDANRRNDARQSTTDAKLLESRENLAAQLAQIELDRVGSREALRDAAAREESERRAASEAGRESRIAAAQRRVDEARQKFADAVNTAAEVQPRDITAIDDRFGGLLDAIGGGIAATTKQVSGTFSGALAGRVVGTERATEIGILKSIDSTLKAIDNKEVEALTH